MTITPTQRLVIVDERGKEIFSTSESGTAYFAGLIQYKHTLGPYYGT